LNLDGQVALSRFTTLGTGGPARAFARPRTLDELVEALRFARERDLPVVTVGLGSNLLAADEGVEALVLKLDGELARVEVDDMRVSAGGGAAKADSSRASSSAAGSWGAAGLASAADGET